MLIFGPQRVGVTVKRETGLENASRKRGEGIRSLTYTSGEKRDYLSWASAETTKKLCQNWPGREN